MVEIEDNPNWLWFVQLLKKDLGLEDGETMTIISDKHQVCSSFLYVYIKTSLVYLVLIVHLYMECYMQYTKSFLRPNTKCVLDMFYKTGRRQMKTLSLSVYSVK